MKVKVITMSTTQKIKYQNMEYKELRSLQRDFENGNSDITVEEYQYITRLVIEREKK